MGYERHNAILISSWNNALLAEAHRVAMDIFASIAPMTPIVTSEINGVGTFLVAPDGSKEGWDESNAGDRARARMIGWLDEHRYEDGSTALAWVEVQYGDGDRETAVVAHSDEPSRRKALDAKPE